MGQSSETAMRNASRTLRFIYQVEDIGFICGLESDKVIVLCALEHFSKTSKVYTKRHRSIAAVLSEACVLKFDSYKRDMRVVHGL